MCDHGKPAVLCIVLYTASVCAPGSQETYPQCGHRPGYAPAITASTLEQVHMLLFFAAVTHIVCSMLALLLGNLKLRWVAHGAGCGECLGWRMMCLLQEVAGMQQHYGHTANRATSHTRRRNSMSWACWCVLVKTTGGNQHHLRCCPRLGNDDAVADAACYCHPYTSPLAEFACPLLHNRLWARLAGKAAEDDLAARALAAAAGNSQVGACTGDPAPGARHSMVSPPAAATDQASA
jgi:hypothetical protein